MDKDKLQRQLENRIWREFRTEFSEKLIRFREERGLSRTECAALLGLKHETMKRFETGRYVPTLYLVFRVVRLLNISAQELF